MFCNLLRNAFANFENFLRSFVLLLVFLQLSRHSEMKNFLKNIGETFN